MTMAAKNTVAGMGYREQTMHGLDNSPGDYEQVHVAESEPLHASAYSSSAHRSVSVLCWDIAEEYPVFHRLFQSLRLL